MRKWTLMLVHRSRRTCHKSQLVSALQMTDNTDQRQIWQLYNSVRSTRGHIRLDWMLTICQETETETTVCNI